MRTILLLAMVSLAAAFLAAATDPPSTTASRILPDESARVSLLVISKTAGFRHDSIPAGIQALREIATENKYTLTATEDTTIFTPAKLKTFDVVIFLNTTGDILTDDQQKAFENFIQSGGGFVGIHSAADTEYDWPWYQNLIGAHFKSHPHIQEADILIWDPAKKVTHGVAHSHQCTDYNLYEGWELTGYPEKVFLRGKLIVDGEQWLGKSGDGQFLKRSPGAPVI